MTDSAKLIALQWLAIGAALLTIVLKSSAYLLTGSVGLLSDALESGINLVAAGAAFASLRYSARPADPNHTFGHEKIEYFSSGVEGGLVLSAGAATVVYAVMQLWQPQPLQQLSLGVMLGAGAAVVNLIVGFTLLRVGRRAGSLLTESSGHHLLSDVFTSVGVVVGLILVEWTNLVVLDGIIAILVGLHILRTGFMLMRRSFDGLMDHAWPKQEIDDFRRLVKSILPEETDIHYLRTRRAGRRQFAEFHLLLDGEMSVRDSHAIIHAAEKKLREAMPELEVSIHVEPSDERESWEEAELKQLGEEVPPTVEPRSGDVPRS